MLSRIRHAVQEGALNIVTVLIPEAIEAGLSADDILDSGLVAGMAAAAEQFDEETGDIPRLLLSARCVSMGLELLQPYLPENHGIDKEQVIIGTVGGDLHDIGKNIVALLLTTIGCSALDLGVDVSTRQFVKAVNDNPDVRVVCLSSLLTTALPEMKNTVEALNRIRKTRPLFIVVGGAPVTQSYAHSIGADAYGRTARDTAKIVQSYLSSLQEAET